MIYDYLSILVAVVFSLILSTIILGASFLLAKQENDIEKVSAYECGFDPFGEARQKFDIRFYLVCILFIIFDLEVSFLFPWTVALPQIGLFGFWSMFVFLVILTLGFVYEWQTKALEWK